MNIERKKLMVISKNLGNQVFGVENLLLVAVHADNVVVELGSPERLVDVGRFHQETQTYCYKYDWLMYLALLTVLMRDWI